MTAAPYSTNHNVFIVYQKESDEGLHVIWHWVNTCMYGLLYMNWIDLLTLM